MRISDWSSDVCSSDLVSTPELVVASCRAGAIGSFPSINARTPGLFDDWMTRIAGELDAARAAGETPAPMAVNLLTHDSNPRFEPDFAIVRKWEPPVVITSVGRPEEIGRASCRERVGQYV